MTQELIDLKTSILEGRYHDALAIIDELEGMSKQAIIRNIESFIQRLMIHLIKNQIEQRLTNSWANSISDSIVQIKKLNFKGNKNFYYINTDEWQSYLEAAIKLAIRPASLEIFNGQLKPKQVSERLDIAALIATATTMLELTYTYAAEDLPDRLDLILAELPGGEEWQA
ncbi:DUF29 family protein [Microseira sp. BLCC-F43]|jgi:hypothetical protein|uniref:DUF29 family protein n=1 Tax=Microseira sp. BLCC-F43 TaxID=3153602 RepID=UPI0035B7C02A